MTLTTEAKNHLGERSFQTYAAWKRACKAIDKDVWFDGDIDIGQAMVGPKPFKKGETHAIGEWDGAEGCIYKIDKKVKEALSLPRLDAFLAGTLVESDELKKVASEGDDHSKRRAADKLEIGAVVEITGDVNFKEQTGEITRFGKDKHFVVVRLYNGGEHSFHSSDVSEADLSHEEHEDDEDDHNKFYVAFYDKDEERSWIGVISKEHGGKWHEKSYKGKAEMRWGQTYMSYLTPDDVMNWIHKDYHRGVEIEGPFFTPAEAEEHVKQNWGRIDEALSSEGGRIASKHKKAVDKLLDHPHGLSRDSYENQKGAHMSWFKTDKQFSPGERRNVATSLDMKEHPHASDFGHGKNYLFHNDDHELEFDDNKSAHLRTHKTKADKQGLDEAAGKSAYAILNDIAKDHGKTGFATLNSKDAARYVNMKKADKIAEDEEGEFGLMTCDESAIKRIINKNPDLLIGDAKKMLGSQMKEEAALKESAGSDMLARANRLKDAGKTKAYHRLMTDYHEHMEGAMDSNDDSVRAKHHKEEGEKHWTKWKTMQEGIGKTGMSKAAHAADVDQSDREYIAQRQFKAKRPAGCKCRAKNGDNDMCKVHGARGKIEEGEVFTTYSDWKQSVLLSHPVQAKEIKFRGKMEGEKTTISAIIPGQDAVYGIWDDAIETGKVISESDL